MSDNRVEVLLVHGRIDASEAAFTGLAEQRATSVKKALVALGLSDQQLRIVDCGVAHQGGLAARRVDFSMPQADRQPCD